MVQCCITKQCPLSLALFEGDRISEHSLGWHSVILPLGMWQYGSILSHAYCQHVPICSHIANKAHLWNHRCSLLTMHIMGKLMIWTFFSWWLNWDKWQRNLRWILVVQIRGRTCWYTFTSSTLWKYYWSHFGGDVYSAVFQQTKSWSLFYTCQQIRKSVKVKKKVSVLKNFTFSWKKLQFEPHCSKNKEQWEKCACSRNLCVLQAWWHCLLAGWNKNHIKLDAVFLLLNGDEYCCLGILWKHVAALFCQL